VFWVTRIGASLICGVMRHSLSAHAAFVAVSLAALCSAPPSQAARDASGQCGHLGAHDDSSWHAMSQRPRNADLLMTLVDEDIRRFRQHFRSPVETWFEASSELVMLCITPDAPSASPVGAWWSFHVTGDGWTVLQQSEWVTNQD
jgi:hypothetical protein